MSHNWQNYNKKLKFSDAKNTRKIDTLFSKQKSVKQELEVDEQSENRPSSADTVIDFVEQSESRPSASISSNKKKNRLLMFLSLKFSFNYVYLH